MARTSWPLLALAGMLLPAGWSWGQAVESAVPEQLPSPRPPAYVLPPVNTMPCVPGIINPILEDSPVAAPGWFSNTDLFLVRPHFYAHFSGSPNQGVDTLQVMTPDSLGTVLSPTFQLGYRLSEQRGEFSLSYRFETAEQSSAAQTNRLDLNQADFDWGNWQPFALAPGWDLRFHVGVRVTTFYFDTRQNFGPAGNGTGLLNEHITNYFAGAGPEAGLDLSWELLPGLCLIGRLTTADVFGNIHQTFSQTTTGLVFSSDSFRNQASSPMLTLQAGLSYSPPGWNYSRLMAGFVWEEYWQLGRLNDSNGNLLNRGAFFRAEINF